MEFRRFEAIFKPKSIAVVGASKNPLKMSSVFLSGYKGSFPHNLYPINPHEEEILGLKAYPSVKDIPDQVDYVFVAVPGEKVKGVIKDCVMQGVNAVAIFSSGFSEFSEEGREREEELVRIAKGVRIIGPNCIGAFSKYLGRSGLTIGGGKVSLVCQSGGNVRTILNLGNKIGVSFSKAISYGNACDLDSTDFIEYFGEDPETKIIIGYIEGIKDGRRFLEVSKK